MTNASFLPQQQDTLNLASHLKEPHETFFYAWTDRLFQLMTYAAFAIRGTLDGPDGRRYLAAYVTEHGEEPLYNQDSLMQIAFSEGAGIALISGNTITNKPDATIRYGGVWSYHEYSHVGGTPACRINYDDAIKIAPAEPFNAQIDSTKQIIFGNPSDEFFPPYVVDKMRQEILSHFPSADPSFNILEQPDYAIKHSIAVGLNTKDVPNETRSMLAQRLTWFMPYYLPLIVLPGR